MTEKLDFTEAIEFMKQLKQDNPKLDVEVFWDRGWGDHGEIPQITIILDGNGQKPLAEIGNETYQKLLSENIIGPNCLRTYKARKLHPFLLGPLDDKIRVMLDDIKNRLSSDEPDVRAKAELDRQRVLEGIERIEKLLNGEITTPSV